MRSKIILVVAIVFGLLAAFLAYNYITSTKHAIENRAYTQVVTALMDIPANTTITDAMVVLKPFPTELRNGKEILEIKEAIGKISPVAFSKGEVILSTRLVKPGEGTQKLSYKVPNGMRAITVPIDEVTGVANLLKVGDRVDLIGIVPANNQNPEARATVILQNIEIIALGSSMSEATPAGEKASKPASLTLALDPQSTIRLKMALENTRFTFTLRSAADKTLANLVPVTLNQL